MGARHAPGANILLVESASESLSDMLAAVDYAAAHANVVSMSWGYYEFRSETSYDGHFNVSGVTFLAASGDSGAGSIWPSASSNVVSVGGTTLTLNADNTINSETGWGNGFLSFLLGGSGGGPSKYETRPGYQNTYFNNSTDPRTVSSKILSGGKRLTPDVAYDSDPNTGFAAYSSVTLQGQSGWFQVGGTSDAAPQWAGLIAIADQARVAAGKSTLSSSDTLTDIYAMATAGYSTYFHDITSGNNGYPAGKGYDLVTGLGSPKADQVVAYLTSHTGTTQSGSGTNTGSTGDTGGKGHPHLALPSSAANVSAIAPTSASPSTAATDALPLPITLLTTNGGTAAAVPAALSALPVGAAAPLPVPTAAPGLPAAQTYLLGGGDHAPSADDGMAAPRLLGPTVGPIPAPSAVLEGNSDSPAEMPPDVTVRPPECDAYFTDPRWAAAAAAPVVPEEGAPTAAGAALAVALGAWWAVPGEKRRRRGVR